jgi:argininosuccinate lyase
MSRRRRDGPQRVGHAILPAVSNAPPEKPRLVEGWGPELMDTAMAERTSPLVRRLFSRPMSLYDLAHGIMLVEQGIIPEAAGRTLLAALLEMHPTDPAGTPLDPRIGDVLTVREQMLVDRLGAEIGGRLHTGRSRGETYNAVLPRLIERDVLLGLLDAELDLVESLLRLADKHVETVMPGYSHMQHAQPTTLAHYLVSFVFPGLRNVERGLQAYARTNQSPAGAGIFGGSAYPIDRPRLAALLGFEGVLANTRDAVWSEDHTLDLVLIANQTMTSVARLAQDLELWSTYEFRMLSLADRHSSSSSIMPQKRNPYSLEYLRGLASTLHGSLMTALSQLKAPSEELDLMIFQPRLFDAVEQSARGATLMARVVDGLEIFGDRMAELAAANFSQATDLADQLSIRSGLAFRTTHRIVGTLVRLADERGLAPVELTPGLLDEAAVEVIGRPLGVDPATLRQVLDARALVGARTLVGGPAPGPMRVQLQIAEEQRDQGRAALTERRRAIAVAEAALFARARALTAGSPLHT